MEEVNDGGGAAEVSDEEGSVMERGALNAGGLWEKRACYTVVEEEEHEKQGEEERDTESQCGGHGERGWVRSLYSNRSVHYDSVCSFPHVCVSARACSRV